MKVKNYLFNKLELNVFIRELFVDGILHSVLQRDGGSHTADACAMEFYFQNFLRCEFYEFDLAAVHLNERPDFFIDATLNTVEEVGFC